MYMYVHSAHTHTHAPHVFIQQISNPFSQREKCGKKMSRLLTPPRRGVMPLIAVLVKDTRKTWLSPEFYFRIFHPQKDIVTLVGQLCSSKEDLQLSSFVCDRGKYIWPSPNPKDIHVRVVFPLLIFKFYFKKLIQLQLFNSSICSYYNREENTRTRTLEFKSQILRSFISNSNFHNK